MLYCFKHFWYVCNRKSKEKTEGLKILWLFLMAYEGVICQVFLHVISPQSLK